MHIAIWPKDTNVTAYRPVTGLSLILESTIHLLREMKTKVDQKNKRKSKSRSKQASKRRRASERASERASDRERERERDFE